MTAACAANLAASTQQVELCESYLVCGMFDDAANLASSILDDVGKCDIERNTALYDLMESAAMVLVQSLGELGRATEILNQVKHYFGSVDAIPVEVLLAGACIQVSKSYASTAREFLEEFLTKWQLENEGYFLASHRSTCSGSDCGNLMLEISEYLEVVEFYAVALLGTVMKDPDRAILWVEKASLPEDARQDILRQLRSLCSSKATTNPLQVLDQSSLDDSNLNPICSVKETDHSAKSESFSMMLRGNGVDNEKNPILKWPLNLGRYLFWLRNKVFNCGRSCTAGSNMRVLLGCLIFVICYILRKKRHDITRHVRTKAVLLKKALMDFWQLAFSYQVNPLAAVQPLPSPNPRSQ